MLKPWLLQDGAMSAVQHCIKLSLQHTLCMSKRVRRLSAEPAASDAAMTLSNACSALVRMSCRTECQERCNLEGAATCTRVQSHLLIRSTLESSRLPACLRRTAQEDEDIRLAGSGIGGGSRPSFTSVWPQERSLVVQHCLEPGLSALPLGAARTAPPPDKTACVAVVDHSLT